VDAVADVASYGRLAVASVNDTFVAFDMFLDIFFTETAPVLLDE
jgi:hypothetical protein